MLIVLHWLEKNLLKIWLFDTVLEEKIEIPADVIQFADQRIQAKKDKDYALADELRTKVLELWFQIKDTKDWYEIIK
jgi:cysteinyl-tRNA synthetase